MLPEGKYKHIRVRHPDLFAEFRVISKMSHLDPDDQTLVRRRIRKKHRAGCKFTVGKLKGGRKLKGRSWKLQNILKPDRRRSRRTRKS